MLNKQKLLLSILIFLIFPVFCNGQESSNSANDNLFLVHTDFFSLNMYKYLDSETEIPNSSLSNIFSNYPTASYHYRKYKFSRVFAITSITLFTSFLVIKSECKNDYKLSPALNMGMLSSGIIFLISNRMAQNNLDKAVDSYNINISGGYNIN